MQNNNTLIEFMAKEEPFAMCIVEGAGYGTVYKISWSLKQPDHFVLHHPESGDLCAVVHKRDPYYRFYNVEKLRKPECKTVYVVTRPDGVRKEFYAERKALESGAIDPCVLTDFDICAEESLQRIVYGMEKAGCENTVFFKSLRNISEYVTTSNDNVFEFWDSHNGKDGEHHYCVIDTYGDYLYALKFMARFYGWKVEEEERYEL